MQRTKEMQEEANKKAIYNNETQLHTFEDLECKKEFHPNIEQADIIS